MSGSSPLSLHPVALQTAYYDGFCDAITRAPWADCYDWAACASVDYARHGKRPPPPLNPLVFSEPSPPRQSDLPRLHAMLERAATMGGRTGFADASDWLARPAAHTTPGAWAVLILALICMVLAAFDCWNPGAWFGLGLAVAYLLVGLEQRDRS